MLFSHFCLFVVYPKPEGTSQATPFRPIALPAIASSLNPPPPPAHSSTVQPQTQKPSTQLQRQPPVAAPVQDNSTAPQAPTSTSTASFSLLNPPKPTSVPDSVPQVANLSAAPPYHNPYPTATAVPAPYLNSTVLQPVVAEPTEPKVYDGPCEYNLGSV